jgi:CDP-4-dehydro-6-deoxyglucose reductase
MTFQIDIQPCGQRYTQEGNQTILDAALADGWMLKHSCRQGTCGSCKGKVLHGSVDHGETSEEVLSQAERDAGMALFCCARPLSDLAIEAPEVTGVRGIAVRQMAARVVSVDKVSDDVAVLRLTLPAGQTFNYLPGQYAQILLRDGSRRCYSMATRAAQDNQIEWHIRHMPNGRFSGHVFNALKPRDLLRIEGPFGSFYLRDSERPMIFLASGTGFAPIKALLEQLREQGNIRPVHLYWGGRKRADLYQDSLLREWDAELDWLHYTPVLSEATSECNWQGATGFVHRQVMQDFARLDDFEVYACGAPIVVDSARRDFVMQCGLDEQHFYADAFI